MTARMATSTPRFPATLPVGPLVAVIARHLERHAPPLTARGNAAREECLRSIRVTPRRYYDWREGRSLTVSIEHADRVITALGLDWMDVWPRDEYPEFAARLDAIDAARPADIETRRAVAA